ncbi:MAG: DUF2505 family protein [Myxococcales bacterium]|nr:DUF2505 family protein [Myxococcales bacterium]
MRFQLHHDFDAPLVPVERALGDPGLGSAVALGTPSIESVTVVRHELGPDTLERVWRFQARAPFGILRGYGSAREMLCWEEHWRYVFAEHAGAWTVVPRGELAPDAPWRRYFTCEGSYTLEPLAGERTRRHVAGTVEVRLPLVGAVVERLGLREIRKAYAAEAATLRALCTPP